MEEKILSGNKRGMTVLLLTILLYAVAIAALVFPSRKRWSPSWWCASSICPWAGWSSWG